MPKIINYFRRTAIAFALVGLIWPPSAVAKEAPTPKTHDVKLTPAGSLAVVVVNAQGKLQKSTRVELQKSDSTEITVGITDEAGRYQFTNLTGGVYQIRTNQGICGCRLWTNRAAPPAAAESLLIVNDRVVRGQRPIREMFRSDPILMTAIVAAAIAIPIAIHQSRDNSSGS